MEERFKFTYCYVCPYWGVESCLIGKEQPVNCLKMVRELSDVCLEDVIRE